MLSEHLLYRPPAGIFIAVKQHGDEERRGLAARNMEKRGASEVTPEIRGRNVKQYVGKGGEAAGSTGPASPFFKALTMSPAHDALGRLLAEEEAKHRGLTQKPSEPDPTDANRSGELRPVSVPSLTQPQRMRRQGGDERARAVVVDDGEFEIAVERRG